MDVIEGMKKFYSLCDHRPVLELPETLPGSLEKEFGEFFTVYTSDHDPDPQKHVNHEIPVEWDTICMIYERIRELIVEGKI